MNSSLIDISMANQVPLTRFTKASQGMHTAKFLAAQNAPAAMVAAGAVGTIFSTVLACRATIRSQPSFESLREELEDIRKMRENAEAGIGKGYSAEDYRADLRSAGVRHGVKIAKEYAPSVGLMSLSLGTIFGAHKMMVGRNAILLATATTLSESYEQYRKRVAEEFGEVAEEMLHKNLKEVKVKDPNTGETAVLLESGGAYSPYARFFDEGSTRWQNDPDMNRITIQCQLKLANHKLRLQGHLFLNEVYDMLGLERTIAGNAVGWIHRPEPTQEGDGFVDFSLYDVVNDHFNRGWEKNVLLDFNVDGPIINKIGVKEI